MPDMYGAVYLRPGSDASLSRSGRRFFLFGTRVSLISFSQPRPLSRNAMNWVGTTRSAPMSCLRDSGSLFLANHSSLSLKSSL